MHCRAKDNGDVAHVLALLAEYGYAGPLILEIEDLTFQPDYPSGKKLRFCRMKLPGSEHFLIERCFYLGKSA